VLLELAPGQCCPFLTRICIRCLGLFHTIHTPSFHTLGPASAYPGHYPRPWLLRSSHRTDACGWYLLMSSTSHESHLLVTRVPIVRFALPLGSCCPPGLVGVNADHVGICRPLSLSILDQALLWLSATCVTSNLAC
jgi:hypothetical protein